MKYLSVVLVILASACSLHAFTYVDTDILLVFRKDGSDDVLFNIGKIDTLLAVAKGQTIAVGNWDVSLVKNAYGTDDQGNLSDGIHFAVLSTTSLDTAQRKAWLSDADDGTTPLERTPSQWQTLWSKIN